MLNNLSDADIYGLNAIKSFANIAKNQEAKKKKKNCRIFSKIKILFHQSHFFAMAEYKDSDYNWHMFHITKNK